MKGDRRLAFRSLRLFPWKHLLKDVRGSVSLLLAAVIVAICLLGSLTIRLAALRQTEHQLIETAALQADTVLAAYDRRLFRTYGVLAFREDAPDHIGAVFPMHCIPGTAHLEMNSAEHMSDGHSLKHQLTAFMKTRTPRSLIRRLTAQQQALREQDGRELIACLEAPRLNEGLSALSEQLDEGLSSAKPEAPEEAEADAPPSGWSDDDRTTLDAGLDLFVRAAKTKLSFAGAETVADPSNAYLSDLPALTEALAEADRFIHTADIPVYDDAGILLYAQQMFKSQPHQNPLPAGHPYEQNLRHLKLANLQTVRNCEVEYILFGKEADADNRNLSGRLLFGTRLLIDLIDYRMSEEKMAQARATGALIAAFVAVASAGHCVIEPEVAADLVWIVESASQAYAEYKALCRGQAVKFRPYDRNDQLLLYYQDYLLLYLLFLKQEVIIQRITDLLEANIGSRLCMGIAVCIDWRGGRDGSLQRRIEKTAFYDECSAQSPTDEPALAEQSAGYRHP